MGEGAGCSVFELVLRSEMLIALINKGNAPSLIGEGVVNNNVAGVVCNVFVGIC